MKHRFLWIAAIAAAALLLAAVAGVLVLRSEWFRGKARAWLVSSIETATGGREHPLVGAADEIVATQRGDGHIDLAVDVGSVDQRDDAFGARGFADLSHGHDQAGG